MKKITILFSFFVTIQFVQSTYSQTLPQVINFEAANNTNLGIVVNDGDASSIDVVGIQFNFILIDNIGNPTNKEIIYNEFGGEYEGLHVALPDTQWRGMSIKTDDGSEFDFNGFSVSENFGALLTFTVEGFKDGISTGTTTIGHPGFTPTTYTEADFTDIKFGDIDEVQIIANVDFSGNFDNFNLGATNPTLGTIDLTTTETELKLFPNPSTNYIEISRLKKPENYTIFNLLGAEILKGEISNGERIHIHNLKKGLYFLKFENGNTLKFIKE